MHCRWLSTMFPYISYDTLYGDPELDLPKHRGRRPHNALSAAFVRSAKPGYYCDGNGLYLRVDRSGARRWEQRLRIQGRNRTLGLGGCQLVSLAEAREKAFMNRKIARSGGDPRTERHKVRDMPTFAEAAARVLEQLRPGWRSPRHAQDWISSVRVYAFPQLGHRPVGEITTADVLAVLTPIWHDKRVTARRVRQRIGAVMKWAVAMGLRPDNPASDVLGQALGRQQAVVQHMRALPHAEVAGAMETVRKSHAYPATKLAFEFLVLTAARSGEVRSAHWDEIDLEAREWTVPAERTKAHRPHRVPLSGRAMEILSEARTLGAAAVWFSRRRRAAHCPAADSPRCFETWVSRPCRTAFVRASGTGAASVPTHRVKSPRPRWPMRFATRWKRLMRVPTSSSAGVS